MDDLAAVQRKLYDVNTKWYNLGLELGLRPPTLDSIDAKYNSDPSQCFRQVLKEWLNGVSPPPTWRAMVNALKSPTVAQYKLAEQIHTELPPLLSTQPLAPQPLSPQSLSPQRPSPQSPSTSSQPQPKSLGLCIYIYRHKTLCLGALNILRFSRNMYTQKSSVDHWIETDNCTYIVTPGQFQFPLQMQPNINT